MSGILAMHNGYESKNLKTMYRLLIQTGYIEYKSLNFISEMTAFNCPRCGAPLDTEELKIDERDNSTIKRCPKCYEFLEDRPKK